jgi:homoserine dehydrogenase
VHVSNVPGVLGRVASCLGRHGVSVKRLEQDLRGDGEPVDMVVVTERVPEVRVQAAVTEIDGFEDVLGPTHRFRIREPDAIE